jgi:hypothetical protein
MDIPKHSYQEHPFLSNPDKGEQEVSSVEGLLRSQVSILVSFEGANPIKWDDMVEELKERGYSTFGQGTALTNTGAQTPAYAASSDEFQWVYLPSIKNISLKGRDVDATIEHFREHVGLIEGQFTSARWRKNFRFYEVHVVNEIEPQHTSPMTIMQRIAPGVSLDQFEGAFGERRPVMYAFRLSSWDGEVPSSLRDSVPWYEMSFQPMVENTDRVICEIVSRNRDLDEAVAMATRMTDSLHAFVELYDGGD